MRRFLGFIQPFADLIDAIGQRFILQQCKARKQAVQLSHAFFRLLKLRTLLLIIALVGAQRPLKLIAARVEFADFSFRIVFKGHRQMVADKAAECLMQALGLLNIKRQCRETFRQGFTLLMQAFNAIFTRRTAKQRQRREA